MGKQYIPPGFIYIFFFHVLGQIFHIVAPLADNKSGEMGSPSARISGTFTGTRANDASALTLAVVHTNENGALEVVLWGEVTS